MAGNVAKSCKALISAFHHSSPKFPQFSNMKANCLGKADKSLKGSIDIPVRHICDLVNSSPSFYTTSSCSGRALVWAGEHNNMKTETHTRFQVEHSTIDRRYFDALSSIQDEFLWLRVEPFILHLCADSLSTGSWMLRLAKTVFPRSGIMNYQEGSKLMLCLVGEDYLDMPLRVKGRDLMESAEYPWLSDVVNVKMERNFKRIQMLEEVLEVNLNETAPAKG